MAWLNLQALMGRIPGIGVARMAFKRTYTEDDFMAKDVSVLAGKFNKVGEVVVPAQQEVTFGQGVPQQPENQGYLYIHFQNATPATVEGLVRLAISNANETQITIVYEERTEKLRGSKTDRTLMIPLPEFVRRRAREDDRLQILLKPDANNTVAKANTDLLVPVTVYQ